MVAHIRVEAEAATEENIKLPKRQSIRDVT